MHLLTVFCCLKFPSLEYWAFEILVFLAGLMPDSEITTSLLAMWYISLLLPCFYDILLLAFMTLGRYYSDNTECIAFTLTYGLGAATRYATRD